jgi:hypothetical protein
LILHSEWHYQSGKSLEEEEIKNVSGNVTGRLAEIRGMLKNEKYGRLFCKNNYHSAFL